MWRSNGLVIPSMYSEKLTGVNYLYDDIFISEKVLYVVYQCWTLSDNLYLGNVYSAISNGYYHKLAQISTD